VRSGWGLKPLRLRLINILSHTWNSGQCRNIAALIRDLRILLKSQLVNSVHVYRLLPSALLTRYRPPKARPASRRRLPFALSSDAVPGSPLRQEPLRTLHREWSSPHGSLHAQVPETGVQPHHSHSPYVGFFMLPRHICLLIRSIPRERPSDP
jgi:hypothetical protein